jgi:hypothetical protein
MVMFLVLGGTNLRELQAAATGSGPGIGGNQTGVDHATAVPTVAPNPFLFQVSQPGEQAPLLSSGMPVFRYQPPEGQANGSQDGEHTFVELPPPPPHVVPQSY